MIFIGKGDAMLTFEEKLRRFKEEKERQKEKEKKKRKKRIKEYQAAYRLAHGHKPRKKQARKRRIKEKRLEFIEQRTVSVYNERWIEREPREEDLYTLEELHNPPEEETGAIRWDVWERLVKECRSMLGNMK